MLLWGSRMPSWASPTGSPYYLAIFIIGTYIDAYRTYNTCVDATYICRVTIYDVYNQYHSTTETHIYRGGIMYVYKLNNKTHMYPSIYTQQDLQRDRTHIHRQAQHNALDASWLQIQSRLMQTKQLELHIRYIHERTNKYHIYHSDVCMNVCT